VAAVKWVVLVPLYAMLEQATEIAIFGRPVGLPVSRFGINQQQAAETIRTSF